MSGVGTLNEKALHSQLKDWYSEPGDRFEVPVGRHVVDIVRDDLLIEIQTRNVSAMRRKLPYLLEDHDVRLVFPIPQVRHILKLGPGGDVLSRRRSPKRGSIFDLFSELVSIPKLVDHPRFSLHTLLIEEVEIRQHVPDGSWRRRGWRTMERSLEAVVDDVPLLTGRDVVALLPELPRRWTTADLARAASIHRRVAQHVAYTLKHMSAAAPVGKEGNSIVYTLTA